MREASDMQRIASEAARSRGQGREGEGGGTSEKPDKDPDKGA
jgi:hypothetical protein